MPVPIVIDLSHHNTVPQSLKDTKAAGIIGVIHKATEGYSYMDDKMDGRWFMAKEAGLLWGLYHFLRPGDMKRQAKFFTDVARKYGDDNTLLCADHEVTDVSLGDLKTFLREVERIMGRKPIIYSGHVLKAQLSRPDPEISSYLLWLAQYASHPTLPPGFTAAWLWQYTDQGTIPGVTPPTDLNAGDVESVKAQWSGAKEIIPEPDGENEVLIEIVTSVEGTVSMSMTPGVGVKVTVLVNGKPI